MKKFVAILIFFGTLNSILMTALTVNLLLAGPVNMLAVVVCVTGAILSALLVVCLAFILDYVRQSAESLSNIEDKICGQDGKK